jgi:coenzyme PQQ precursor peptide PqqA
VGRDREHSYGRGEATEATEAVVRRRGREVSTMETTPVWEAPEFEEIGVAPEVTMYVAQID